MGAWCKVQSPSDEDTGRLPFPTLPDLLRAAPSCSGSLNGQSCEVFAVQQYRLTLSASSLGFNLAGAFGFPRPELEWSPLSQAQGASQTT